MADDLETLLARLLRAPERMRLDEHASRALGEDLAVMRAEIATLREEVMRLREALRAVVLTVADGTDESLLRSRLRGALNRVADADHEDEQDRPPAGTPYRGGAPTIAASACARCGTPLEGESAAFLPGVGSVCTGCYRASDAR